MKKVRKSVLFLLSFALMMSFFVGCSSPTPSPSPSQTASQDTPTANAVSPTPTESAASGEPVTITMYDCATTGSAGLALMQQAIADFQTQHPNITVDYEYQDGNNYHEKLATLIASDTLPNLFATWGGSEMVEAVKSGKLLDLTSFYDANPDFKAQFSTATLSDPNITYSGYSGIYGVPYDYITTGFYYNKDLFAQAGIAAPPATWDDMYADIAKLKAIDVIPWAYAGSFGTRTEHVYDAIFYRMNGVDKAAELSNRTAKYSDDFAVAPWTEIVNLMNMGAFGPEPASVDWNTELSMFETGKAAMDFNLSSLVSTYQGPDSQVKGKIGFFPTPVYAGKEQYANDNFAGGDMAYAIAAHATQDQINAAWELAKYLGGIEVQSALVNENILIPTNLNVTIDPSKSDPLMAAFQSIMTTTNKALLSVCTMDTDPGMLSKFRDVAAAVINQQLTPQQAGAALDDEIANAS